ncbi:MAG TPA: hypothetical protein VKL21_01050 [Candidatus Methanoperedens sp.]|nr:hypothetical protein [Candidatus Methanoperedens sp.]
MSEYHNHSFTDAARKAAITCTDCHMPDVINTNSKLRGALTTHNFKSLNPENSIKYGADVMPNSCTYRCHQDKGADKTARANWAISAMSPVAAATTASATTTKAPAFELIFAVTALFIATLVRRR